jgi:integrase
VTRTDKTEEKYEKRALQLVLACSRDLKCLPRQISISTMADWLISKKCSWSPSTWRQYRAAVSFTFGPGMSVQLYQSSMPASARRGMRTSGLKEKRLPPSDLEKLLDHLISKNTSDTKISASRLAFLFMICGTITGLRPCEWPSAEICPATPTAPITLRVRNAKNTNGRANGELREILLPDLNKKLDRMIGLLAAVARKFNEEGAYEKRLSSAAKALYRANKELWPNRKKHYTLYSPRHQAAANWKTVFTREQIAALMGHCSIKTATMHYGRRSAGRSCITPGLPTVMAQPSDADVALVSERAESLSQKTESTALLRG